MKSLCLIVSAALFTSSCAFKLGEGYESQIVLQNNSGQVLRAELSASTSSLSEHGCSPGHMDRVIEVPAGEKADVKFKIDCRMPPERMAKIYRPVDQSIGSVVIPTDQVAEALNSRLSLASANQGYDVEVAIRGPITVQDTNGVDVPLPWRDIKTGEAWITDLKNGSSLVQVALGENSADAKLRIESSEADTAELTLEVRDEAAIALPFRYRSSAGVICSDLGCWVTNWTSGTY